MADPKEIPPADLSLKFMAWNIKQIDESLKRIAISLEEILSSMRQDGSKSSLSSIQSDSPF